MPAKLTGIAEQTREHRKIITKMIEKARYKYGRHTIWRDFIYMSAAALSQTMDFRQSREDEYLRIINSYDKATQDMFPEMFGELVLAFEEESFADILGEIYTALELTNKSNGQFFTPYHVSKLMAAMSYNADSLSAEIKQKGYITVNDPCCGAGTLLIAFADYCKECGINYQQSVLFIAQDIDPVTALMTYIQLSLFGMSGYVIIGDSLLNPPTVPMRSECDIWYTPFYFVHRFNVKAQKDIAVMTETTDSGIVSAVSKPKQKGSVKIAPQMDINVTLHESKNGQFEFIF
ncbi:MAG: SAM-dependent methyltransferase [Oscillospiraceae bacterium]|nr:SAM-dependent methyltransferase [Oscillospiraceae bacterium]